MYGIANPVISERTWRAAREITAEQFAKDLAFAEDVAFSVNEWRGESRDGKPLAIVWVAGRRSGTLMSAFEITERPQWRYAHTGWSAHSSYIGQHSYWLVRYEGGQQVAMYENGRGLPIRFKTYESATRKADALNKADGIAV